MGEENEDIDENVCVLCGHKLSMHIDEGDGWRCHSLGPDFHQCECYLRKNRAEGDISFYDLKERVKEMKERLEEMSIES